MIDDGTAASAQGSADGGPGKASFGRAFRFNRRWFVGSLLVLLSGLLGWLRFGRDWSDAIEAIVRKQLPFLDLDPEGVRTFATDLIAGRSTDFPAHFNVLARVPVALWDFLPARDELAAFEVEVARTYLLSTDFFSGGADESATVLYVGFFDRYVRPCSNPFVAL